MTPLILFVILIALLFDFLNGFHDAANSIATVVTTRVLTPDAGGGLGRLLQLRRAFGFGTQWPRPSERG
jgi:PiT family inorganic phosphate transporter